MRSLQPRDRDRLARMMPPERLGSSLAELKAGIAQQVDRLPAHQAFVDRYCAQAATGVAA